MGFFDRPDQYSPYQEAGGDYLSSQLSAENPYRAQQLSDLQEAINQDMAGRGLSPFSQRGPSRRYSRGSAAGSAFSRGATQLAMSEQERRLQSAQSLSGMGRQPEGVSPFAQIAGTVGGALLSNPDIQRNIYSGMGSAVSGAANLFGQIPTLWGGNPWWGALSGASGIMPA